MAFISQGGSSRLWLLLGIATFNVAHGFICFFPFSLILPFCREDNDSESIAPQKCAVISNNQSSQSMLLSTSGGGEAKLITPSSGLCVLFLTTITGDVKPLARTYSGNEWEATGGDFSNLVFDCTNNGTDTICETTLPPFSLEGETYELVTYSTDTGATFSEADEIARFLEQASFGASLADIENVRRAPERTTTSPDETSASLSWFDALLKFIGGTADNEEDAEDQSDRNGAPTMFVSWMKEQMDPTITKPSLHRAYFRESLNSRFEVPIEMGLVTHPCHENTRYRRFAFSRKDNSVRVTQFVDVETSGNGKRLVKVDGFLRTVATSITTSEEGEDIPDGTFQTCGLLDWYETGTRFQLSLPGWGCTRITFDGQEGNPAIHFDPASGSLPMNLIDLDLLNPGTVRADGSEYYDSDVAQEIILTRDIIQDIAQCSDFDITGAPVNPVFAKWDGLYWIHDPRFVLLTNTLDDPLTQVDSDRRDAIADRLTLCPTAPRTFLNEHSCQIALNDFCSAFSIRNVPIELSLPNLQKIYEATGGHNTTSTRYVYAIDGLKINSLNPSPCDPRVPSRWVEGQCDGSGPFITEGTRAGMAALLESSTDSNVYVRDIFMDTDESICDGSDLGKQGFEVRTDAQTCWKNVHPQHLSVFDMTYWTRGDTHPGNSERREPIKEFAWLDVFTLTYPIRNHPMERWEAVNTQFSLIGRLGDTVSLTDQFPDDLLTIQVASAFDALNAESGIVCGSPGEVASNPLLGGDFTRGSFEGDSFVNRTTGGGRFAPQRKQTWISLVLESKDQLRQRMAWALNQILVITAADVSLGRSTETFLAFYDIFVRHAFGNYKDILMEIVYAPHMGETLTYVDSKSTSFVWVESDGTKLEYPDENFAREIMQLFTTGLVKMEPNGNTIIENGQPVLVYGNDDIEEYARLYTGFTRQGGRGNTERESSRIDPMTIETTWRDQFPKMGLDGLYIGDRYPLCADLPDRHFLLPGARYRRVGPNGKPDLQNEVDQWGVSVGTVRTVADPNGDLFAVLCDSDADGRCQYPMNVVLDKELQCSGESYECGVETLRMVEVESGVFYEYVRLPCVHQAFFPNAKKVVGENFDSPVFCADPRTPAASVACCTDETCCTSTESEGYDTFVSQLSIRYWGERVTYQTAESRCFSQLCDFIDPKCSRVCREVPHWTSAPCQLMAKVDPNYGTIAIVHTTANIEVAREVRKDSKTFFRVHWGLDDGLNVPDLPQIVSIINTNSQCSPLSDGNILCPVAVQESVVYSSWPESVESVLNELWIGAFDPSSRATSQITTNGVTVYNFEGKRPDGIYSDSVFGITDKSGRRFFLKNEKSKAHVIGSNLSFRNPPHFVSILGGELRDIQYETEAAVDQYLYHPSTAPFLAVRFAQRFGNSEPSPRYIAVISEAFCSGEYVVAGNTFGKGVYGDLEATVAAVLLDREARDPVLDFDFGHGCLREPIIKLISVMRALEYRAQGPQPLTTFPGPMNDLIGQDPLDLPSVFSFFRPEFKLSGSRSSNGGLVSPEAEVYDSPKMINTMNGLYSLLRFGLSNRFFGFGETAADGFLEYSPSVVEAATVVDEMATLLTAGRLSAENREIAQEVYEETAEKSDALILVQQLIVSSAEFHSTGRIKLSGTTRPRLPQPGASAQDYKAVVIVLLDGGVDSWNMFVPNVCEGANAEGKNIRQQYLDERGILAMSEGQERSRTISVDRSRQALEQPCEEFVVHDQLQIVQELFDDGDLSFFANMGVLNQPVDKLNYLLRTRTQLFAHNRMVEEAQRLDPYDINTGTGFLGRALDILEGNGLVTNSLSIDAPAVGVTGSPNISPDVTTVSRNGLNEFNPSGDSSIWDLTSDFFEMNEATTSVSNSYAEVWAAGFPKAIDETASLIQAISQAPLQTGRTNGDDDERMAMAARLIQSHPSRGVDRDVIFVNIPRWDHHADLKARLRSSFGSLNSALTLFVNEMKALDLWDKVTVGVASDFGRTLTPNTGGGSDHAWAGHYFMMGGGVKGGLIHGQYPFDITANGPLNIGSGRGRMIPSQSWESMWNGIVQWIGISVESDLNYVLPNRGRSGAVLLNQTDLYD